jgi:hypothetical protein
MSNFELFEAFLLLALMVGSFLLFGFASYVVVALSNQPTVGFVAQVRACYAHRAVKVIRYVAIGVGCVVFVVGFAPRLADVLWPPQPPALVSGEIATVDVNVFPIADRPAAHVSNAEQPKIEALAQVLRAGTLVEDHKCGNTGRISFRFTDGHGLEVGILAGHDGRFYEYRLYAPSGGYSVFRVDRKPFLTAMANLGLPELDLGLPE